MLKPTLLSFSLMTGAAMLAQPTAAQDNAPPATTAPEKTAKGDDFNPEWFYGNEEQRAKHNELVGKYRPELHLEDWMVEELDTEKDLVGKVVVVDLWATWCGPCIGGIPHLNKLYNEYKEEGLIILGVCTSKSGQENMANVVEQHNIAYPVAKDPTLKTSEAWRVMWYPTYAVVDRNGVLRALGVLDKDGLDEIVKTLLAEEYDEEIANEVRKEAKLDKCECEDCEDCSTCEQCNAKKDDGNGSRMVEIPADMFERGTDNEALNAIRDKPAPALEVSGWLNSDGESVTLESLQGKVVLLDYWATW